MKLSKTVEFRRKRYMILTFQLSCTVDYSDRAARRDTVGFSRRYHPFYDGCQTPETF